MITVSSRQLNNKVRDFQFTMEDAARLAECFNSFDESDSWPGGFTHGDPYTAHTVLEEKKKRRDLRVLVAYSGDKIVGHCNVTNAEMDPEAAYVGTLGVNPRFQGQGYGKAMLIEAAETAARLGKRRMDLHTWPGNLKAMPLYKRVGYNWVPGTRVLMESHIPGILNSPMFAEFFKRHYWYDTLKREIGQVPDDLVENGLGVYKYVFAAENGDRLEVRVDRDAKGISGFKLIMDGHTLSAHVEPEIRIGYIGFDAVPVRLTILNDAPRDLSVRVIVAPGQDLSVKLDENIPSVIAHGGELVVGASYSIENTAEHLDRELEPAMKVKTQAEWDLTLGNGTVSLFSGLIPHEVISLLSSPPYPCLPPGASAKMEIVLQSNLGRPIDGSLIIDLPEAKGPASQTFGFGLTPGERTNVGFELATGSKDANSIIPVHLSVFIDEKSVTSLVNEKTLNVPVIGESGALAYEAIDGHFVIETEAFRGVLLKAPPMRFASLENKVSHEFFRGGYDFLLSTIGYPFPSGGNEWSRKKFQVLLRNEGTHAQIELVGDSTERPGLTLNHTYRAYPSRGYLEIMTKLTNKGSSKLTNLGIQTGGWMELSSTNLRVPIRGSIYSLDSVEWTGDRQLPNDPKSFHESWAALDGPDGRMLVGYVWEREHLAEVSPMRGLRPIRVEYRLPDLDVGESIEKVLLRVVISQGDWNEVRSLWARLDEKPEPVMELHGLRSDLEIEIAPRSFRSPVKAEAPMLIDQSLPNDMEIRVRVLNEDPVSAHLTITMPQGLLANRRRKLSFSIDGLTIDSPFVVPVRVTVGKGDKWLRKGGEVLLRFENRVRRVPLSAIIYDSQSSTTTNETTIGGMTLHEVKSGHFMISVSPEYLASLVRFGSDGGLSLFQDTFPRADPFMWVDRHFTGVNPIIQALGVWDWQTGLQLERWSVSLREDGPWVGFEMKTRIEHCSGLKGMNFTLRHMLLKGTPVISSEIEANNGSRQWKRLTLGLQGVPRLNGRPQSIIYTAVNNRNVIYEPTVNRAEIIPTPQEGWAAFKEPDSGLVLGVISDCKTDDIIGLSNMNENAQWVRLSALRDIEPDGKASVKSYFVVTDNVDDIVLIRNLTSTG